MEVVLPFFDCSAAMLSFNALQEPLPHITTQQDSDSYPTTTQRNSLPLLARVQLLPQLATTLMQIGSWAEHPMFMTSAVLWGCFAGEVLS
jgi:hypothetical protein